MLSVMAPSYEDRENIEKTSIWNGRNFLRISRHKFDRKLILRHHESQRNDIQHTGTQHSDTQYKEIICDI
jgi:hypothetical protein